MTLSVLSAAHHSESDPPLFCPALSLWGQLEEEKAALLGAKQEAEQEKAAIRLELGRLEQEKRDLAVEHQAVGQALQAAEESREKLERELLALLGEQEQVQEQLGQVSFLPPPRPAAGCPSN